MPADDYTPSEAEVREVWVDDRISRDPSRYPHGEAHVPELEREFDRWLARVRAEAGAQALRGIADEFTACGKAALHALRFTEATAWESIAGVVRARADTITQEDTP